ncbi:conserved hypothetical protein [Methylobacterium sp. 4-46]|uniref:DUF4337 domain-containing protein n=1 Tax=unclassified Methylobacterium TaxID=2615210 RepID=UPI000152E052|nr:MULTISPECIES: DUF4337 domain-containing protein [Methylobacterium]ACA17461.1 conserved hypothetical protein [Methylobacterium sp. 4-46]WFT83146.1 DUF4337 domain-containing protein [Methylobacterium nodulans]
MSGGHGSVEGSNKKVALLISVLALFLALGETFAKSAQTDALGANVQASNLWSFFQAKTIRATMVRTASEQAALEAGAAPDAVRKQVEDWQKTIARWESEPSTGEGRKELAARAKEAEERRDLALARYHHYEVASAAFQIGIVLASAQVITGIVALAVAGGLLGVAGIGMLGVGLLAPHAIHLF